ncbi:MAG: acyl-CoA thioesterase [Acidimicrobiales bacterium]
MSARSGRFAADTGVTPIEPGRYTSRIDGGWWVQRGPNGGYVAAIVLRALVAAVGDAERLPRSLTIHYLRPPVEGPVEIDTTIERAGRSVTMASARLSQGGETLALALGAFGSPRAGSSGFDDTVMPEVAPPDRCPPLARPPFPLPIGDRYECLHGVGGELFTEGPDARTGGWIRLADGEPADVLAVAAFTDAWPPAVFTRSTQPLGVPTVDLTIHFRQPGTDPLGWFLVAFSTRLSVDGYLEEDGEVWSEDGRLLAQSRQLAIAVPMV